MFGIMYVRFSIDDHDQVWVVEFVSVFGLAQYKTYVSSVQSNRHTFIQMHTIAASSQCTFTCCRCIVKNVPLTNGPNKCTFSPWALIYVEYRTRLTAGNTIAMNFSINPRISSLECQMHMHVIMISVKSFGTFFPFVWALPLSFIYSYIIIIIWIDSRPLVKVDKIWNVSITLMLLFSPIVASMQTSTVFSMSLSEFMSSFVSSYRSHAYNCDV